MKTIALDQKVDRSRLLLIDYAPIWSYHAGITMPLPSMIWLVNPLENLESVFRLSFRRRGPCKGVLRTHDNHLHTRFEPHVLNREGHRVRRPVAWTLTRNMKTV